MSSIQTWKLTFNSTVISQVLTFLPNVEQAKVVSKALDGSIYIQTIGEGTLFSEVEILSTREEMTVVNELAASASLIAVTYRDFTYYGYINEDVSWDAIVPGEWYKGSFKLLIEASEVS